MLGIDPSKEYIGYANSRNPFPARAKFQVGHAQQLSFPDATFENSFSLLVFNFIPERKKALTLGEPGNETWGLRLGRCLEYGAGMRMLRLFWDAAVKVDPTAEKLDELHMPLCRSGELAELWKQNGLEHFDERPLDITMKFESFADYWDPFLLGQGPAGAYVRNINEERRQALRSEVKRRLALGAEGAPFSLSARAWAVRGIVPNRR